jgi:4-hydroxybenzoate polyprenyltransferase
VAEPSEADLISNPERTHFVARYRMYYVIIIITSFIVMVAWSLAEGWLVFLTTIAFPLSSVLYVVPFLPFRKIKRIKEIPGLKSIYVSSCWSILVLLAVAIQNEPVEVLPVVFLMVFVFIRSVVGGLLGDIRDMEGDEAANVRSLPAIMGKKNCLMLLEILHVCSVIMTVLFIWFYHLPVWVYGIVVSTLIGYFFHTKIKQQRYAPGVYFDLFDLEYHSYVPFMLLVRLIAEA